MKSNGDFDYLFKLDNRTIQDKDFIGWMGDFNPGDEQYTYLAGVFFNPEAIIPENYEYRDIPNCTMAVVWLQKAMKENGIYLWIHPRLWQMQ